MCGAHSSTGLCLEPFAAGHTDGVVALCRAEGWESWTHERTLRALSAPGVIASVAVEGEAVVGAAELLSDGAVMAYLGLLVVAEPARGRGIGRALIAEVFARSGMERFDLLTDDAVGFYRTLPHTEKPGFRLYA